MNKKTILTWVTAALLVACGGKGTPGQEVTPPTTEDEKAEAAAQKPGNTEEEVLQRVEEIYAHVHAAYENFGEGGTDLSLDELYCSKEWRQLVAAVNEHDMSVDDIGFFSADYWVEGQDAGNVYADNIMVESIDADENGKPVKATVTFTLHNLDSVTPMRLTLVKERDAWMVDNFVNLSNYPFNWKEEMKKYLAS